MSSIYGYAHWCADALYLGKVAKEQRSEIEALRAEVRRLKAENERLRIVVMTERAGDEHRH